MEEEDDDDQLVADGRHVRHRGELLEFPGYQTWCWGQLTLETECTATGTVPALRGPKLLTRVVC